MSRKPRVTGMGRAAVIVAAGILLSRVLGLLREIVLSNDLGNRAAGDVYDAAFAIPDFMFYLMAGGYMTVTFIPILSRYLVEGRPEEGWRAFTAVLRVVALGITAAAALGVIFAPQLIDLVYVSFPEVFGQVLGESGARLTSAQLDEVVALTRIVMPAQVFFVLGSLFMAVQYAQRRFLVPTLAPIIYNVAIIAGGRLAGTDRDLPAVGFVWGALAGAVIGNFALQWWGAHRAGLRITAGVPWRHPALREYMVLALPLMVGQSIVVLDEQFVRVFGQFGEEGAIFVLGRARRLNMLPVGVIAQAAGVAAYPYLARLAAEGRLADLTATVTRAIRYVVFAGIAATGLVIAVSQPAVRVVYQRGEFSSTGTILAAAALVYYALGIPIWGAQQVLGRAFYARRQMWAPVVIGTAVTIGAIPLFRWLPVWLGVESLALASTVSLTVYTVLLGVVWFRRTASVAQLREIAVSLGRVAAASSTAGLGAWFVAAAITGDVATVGFGTAISAVAASTVVFGLVFLVAARLAGSSEPRELWARRTGRGQPSSGSA